MTLPREALEAIDMRVAAAIASSVHNAVPGSVVNWTPPTAMVVFDGSDAASPVLVFSGVTASPGDRCGLIRLGLDWVVFGAFGASAGASVRFALKQADTTIDTDTSVNADPHLTIPDIAANKVYALTGSLLHTAQGSIIDIKADFTFPADSVFTWGGAGPAQDSGNNTSVRSGQWMSKNSDSSSPTATIVFGTCEPAAGSVMTSLLAGTLRTGDTVGAITLRWAQQASNAASLTVYKDSWLRLEEMVGWAP